jgi:hypothetical protein
LVALAGGSVSDAAIQASNTQTVRISQSPPAQEAGPFELFGKPLTLKKGFDVKLELDVTHTVRVEVGDRSFSVSGKGGTISGSGRIGLQGGEVYPVKETYTFKAAVDSVFIKGEFPVDFTVEWNVLALDTGVYNFGVTGSVQELNAVIAGDVAGSLKADALGSRIVIPVATVREVPGGQKLVYQATFTGRLERTATLDWTGQTIPEWDVDGDGSTNIVDLVRVALRFGEVGVSTREDVNGDKVVNIVDLVILARHFGESLRLPAAPSLAAVGGQASARLVERPMADGRMRVDLIADSDVPVAAYDVTLDLSPRWSLESVENGDGIGQGFTYRVPTADSRVRSIGVATPVRTNAVGERTVASFVCRPLSAANAVPATLRSLTLADTQARIVWTRIEPATRRTTTFVAATTELRQNFPNPFNPETWIPFSLASSGRTTIEVFDIAGRRVRTLDLGVLEAGDYASRDRAAYWDGRNDFGEPVASGIFLYRLTSGSVVETRRMVVAR